MNLILFTFSCNVNVVAHSWKDRSLNRFGVRMSKLKPEIRATQPQDSKFRRTKTDREAAKITLWISKYNGWVWGLSVPVTICSIFKTIRFQKTSERQEPIHLQISLRSICKRFKEVHLIYRKKKKRKGGALCGLVAESLFSRLFLNWPKSMVWKSFWCESQFVRVILKTSLIMLKWNSQTKFFTAKVKMRELSKKRLTPWAYLIKFLQWVDLIVLMCAKD